jgi:hypothetical protein
MLGAAALQSEQPGFDLLFIGTILFFVGLFLWNRLRSKERQNTRFSRFRKRSDRDDQKKRENDHGWEDRFND